jgi:hypothetical protein
VTLLSLPRIKRGRRMNNGRNRMKKTRWKKWWIVGDISSVCNVDLLSSRRLKLHRQCLVNPKDCRTQITSLLTVSQIRVLLFPVHQIFLLQRRKYNSDPFVACCRLFRTLSSCVSSSLLDPSVSIIVLLTVRDHHTILESQIFHTKRLPIPSVELAWST